MVRKINTTKNIPKVNISKHKLKENGNLSVIIYSLQSFNQNEASFVTRGSSIVL